MADYTANNTTTVNTLTSATYIYAREHCKSVTVNVLPEQFRWKPIPLPGIQGPSLRHPASWFPCA